MTLGWLWFFVSLGPALILADLHQLRPMALVLWAWMLALGVVLILFAATAYLLHPDRR